jgi:hydroxymethylbilane synthase
MGSSPPLRLGTRGSALALAQAQLVSDLLGGAEIVPLVTTGDGSATDGGEGPVTGGGDGSAAYGDGGSAAHGGEGSTARDVGDKSRWVLELEQALRTGEIDLAVHSAKDVPGALADGLILLGAPPRAAAEDVLCRRAPDPDQPPEAAADQAGLPELAPGARVGTSSIRRAAQLRAVRADLEIVAIRGNVDTRLRKLGAGDLDALALARAGLQRLGREDALGTVLDPVRFVPSPGQGTLALEGRAEDPRVREAVLAIADERTFACLRAERAVAHALEASCDTPLGVHARDAGCGCLHLRAWVGLADGSVWIADELLGGFYDPEQLGRRMAQRMLDAGAGEILRGATRIVPARP